MNHNNILLSGIKMYEYLLVINPHEELAKKIMQVKQEFYAAYKASSAVYGKPHITLVNFIQYEPVEAHIINRLRSIAMGQQPLLIELRDYGSFPAHTIYINIVSKVPIQGLVKAIRTAAQRLMKPDDDNKPHFILEPHLTIARKLQPWQYEQGYKEYSQKPFTGRFIADSMLLLKRPVGELKYHRAEYFEFKNLPVATKQGDLF